MYTIKGFSKSIKFSYSGTCHSVTLFYNIFQNEYLVPCSLSFSEPSFSFLSFWPISFAIFSIMMLPNTLLGMDSSVIPLQLEQLLQSPLFGNVFSFLLLHSLGVFSSSQILLYNVFSHFTDTLLPAFSISPVILSNPGALLFLNLLSSCLISCCVILPVSIFALVIPSFSILASLLSCFLFSTSEKCSSHLFIISVSLVKFLQFLSFIIL